MNKKTRSINKSAGFTLLEILFGVIVVGIIFSVLLPQLGGARDKGVLVRTEAGSMSNTFEKIKERYQREVIDDTLTNEVILRGRLQSEGYKTNGTSTIYNSFGGLITIEGVADNGMTWTSTLIPTNSCAALLDATKKIGFETVEVEGTTLQYSVATADEMATACEGAGTNDEVTIVWTKTEV